MIDHNWLALKAEKEDYGRHHNLVQTYGHNDRFLFRVYQRGAHMLTVGKENFFVDTSSYHDWTSQENYLHDCIRTYYRHNSSMSVKRVSIKHPTENFKRIENLKIVQVTEEKMINHYDSVIAIKELYLIVDGKIVKPCSEKQVRKNFIEWTFTDSYNLEEYTTLLKGVMQ